jgi:hypothetical protein
MGELWAVVGDKNSEGDGDLTLSGDSSPGTVFVNNIAVIVGTTNANPDANCIPLGPPHCNPKSSAVSGTVFAYGKGAHRNNDSRVCGATTVVTNESTVIVG